MKLTRTFFEELLLLFLLLGIFFIPFKWNVLGFHTDVINTLFFPIVRIIADFFEINLILEDLSSDSKAFYILYGILLFFAIVLAVLSSFVNHSSVRRQLGSFCQTIIAYYLALILFKYGLDKLLKTQFYLPEPNILYTPLGKLDKDILFWSTMGSSHIYNVFMGIAEIIPALLLIFKRTRRMGGLIAVGVFINILTINLSFDISVKLYAAFLLALSLYISTPTIKGLLDRRKPFETEENNHQQKASFSIHPYVRFVIVILFFLEALFPLAQINSWNDDLAKRPFLHGAYEALDQNGPVKRFFIHRDGYLIFQDQRDNFVDFRLTIDRNQRIFHLEDYDRTIQSIPYRTDRFLKSISLQMKDGELEFTALKWNELPLLQEQFHWTVD